MMIDLKVKLEQWIDKHSERERIMLLCLLIGVSWYLWYLLFAQSVSTRFTDARSQLNDMHQQIAAMNAQSNAILQKTKDKNWQLQTKRLRVMDKQMQNMEDQLKVHVSSALPEAKLPGLLTMLFAAQPGVKMDFLKAASPIPFAVTEANNLQLPNSARTIRQYNVELSWRGSFASSVGYLDRLNSLRWHLFWDTLDYHVNKWPEASVTVGFHVLGYQAGTKT